MSQRLRNQQLAVGSNFPSSQVQGLDQAFGYSMSAYKQATQTLSAQVSFVNDDTLWTELPSGPSRVTLILPLTLTAAGGLKLQFVADQGLTISLLRMQAIFLLDGTAPSVQPITALSTPVNGGTTNAWTGLLITGSVNVTNKGVLQLQWSQQASSGSSAVLAGATLDTVQITS